jgi:hypothetical protein
MSKFQTIITDVTYAELVALINSGGLEPGCYYRITDYQTVHYMLDGNWAADILFDAEENPVINTTAVEPLTVRAISETNLAPEAYSEQYPQDVMHYDWNPENWKFDLAFSAFDEAPVAGFKGVIYFRHDKANNVYAGYDWRKALNRRWKFSYPEWNAETTYGAAEANSAAALGTSMVQTIDGIYASKKAGNLNNAVTDSFWWTHVVEYAITPYVCDCLDFAQDADDYIDVPLFYSQREDAEVQYKDEVKNVFIEPSQDNLLSCISLPSTIQNNVFALYLNPNYDNWWEFNNPIVDENHHEIQVSGIKIGMFSSGNTFLGGQRNNTFGDSLLKNIFGEECYGNLAGTRFQTSFCGRRFMCNTMNTNFFRNLTGYSFYYNHIGGYYYKNHAGSYVRRNSIGAVFSYNRR